MTRAEKARSYFLEGYNCAQAVALAYSDVLGMNEADIAKAMSAFGGGFGRMGEVCGALSGATMVLGMAKGYSDPKTVEGKAWLYEQERLIAGKFREENGSILCRELLDEQNPVRPPQPRTESYYKDRPCLYLVESAAAILEKYLSDNP